MTEAQMLSEKDMSVEQLDFIRLMYESGVSTASISTIMSKVVDNGQFLTKTIKNITRNIQSAIDVMSDIDHTMSIAEKTIARLNV